MEWSQQVEFRQDCNVFDLFRRERIHFYWNGKADKLEGTKQFHEELGRKSELFGKYNLQKGFCNFLIDDKGVIIAANVAPEDLTKVLKKG